MTLLELKEFLDEKSNLYENPNFINDDPIQIPHLFRQKEDILRFMNDYNFKMVHKKQGPEFVGSQYQMNFNYLFKKINC